MNIAAMIITVAGLAMFEIISSVDNAIINAEVLSTMRAKARKWFLFWGLLFAVFIVRGLLPWVIVWVAMPGLGPIGALLATFSSDPAVHHAVEESTPILLAGGGVFLVFLFLHWIFLEPKNVGLPIEPYFAEHGVWFYAVASIFLALVVWFSMQRSGLMGFSAVVGSTAFFITNGFKQSAEEKEKRLTSTTMSDLSKILYLEIIDLTFSIDGVLGAFAFTLSVPLILIGNGIGAFVVRELTVGNVERIKTYAYIKNGAMYSILGLGAIMLCDAFGIMIPSWVSPLATFAVIGFFFGKSVREKRVSGER